jgi:DNA recombination protein RmuC
MNVTTAILLVAVIIAVSVVAYLWARNKSLLLINEQKETEIKSLKTEYADELEKVKADYITSRNEAIAEERRRCDAEKSSIIESHKSEKESILNLCEAKLKEYMAQMDQQHQESLKKDKEELKRYSEEQIMSPVSNKLAELNKTVESVREGYIRDSAENNEWRKNVTKTMADSIAATNQLTGSIRSKGKVQGDWGETILENTLENCGLRKGVEFEIQPSSKDESGNQLRPDIIFHCPGDRKIVLDSKVSLTAFIRYANSKDDTERESIATEVYNSIWAHVKELSNKDYNKLKKNMLDVVIMFLPNEGALSVALDVKPDLYDLAYNKGVIITTPSTLMIILHLIKDMWIRDKQEENVEKILSLAGELYDKYATLSGYFSKLDKSLKTTMSNYDDVRKCLSEGNGSYTKRMIEMVDLGAKRKKSKQIDPALMEQDTILVSSEISDAEVLSDESDEEN